MTITRTHKLMTPNEAAIFLSVDLQDLSSLGIQTSQKQKSERVFYERANLDAWKVANP